ncbi:MAG: hypothetical protein E3J72_05430 [Planctomycetota bacterium]|nr:MAG: hypothetical protein E3J72_05430 [Planctomycetota bacterium]
MNNVPDNRERMPLWWKIALWAAVCLILGIVLNCIIIGYAGKRIDIYTKEFLSYASISYLCAAMLLFLACYIFWRKRKLKKTLDEEKAKRLSKKYFITAAVSGIIALLLFAYRIVIDLFMPPQPFDGLLEVSSVLGTIFAGIPLLIISILSFIWFFLIRMECGKREPELIDPSLITRRKHYFYVLVFSLTAWLFIAETIAAFVPFYIEGSTCECGYHSLWHNISYLVFGGGAIICGLVFSFPLNRLGLVSVSKPDDRGVKLSRLAGYGKALFGLRGLAALAIIAAVYISFEYMFRDEEKKQALWAPDATPLLCAAGRGDIETVISEMEKGEDVNVRGWGNSTPLHGSAYHGRLEVVKYLTEKGAAVNVKTYLSFTPLHYAAFLGHTDIAAILLEKGANINAIDHAGTTPLWRAIEDGHKAFIEFLIHKGASVNGNKKVFNSPLHKAVEFYEKDIVKLLIGKGADVNAINGDGKTPLDLALTHKRWGRENRRKPIAELLRSHGAKTGEELKAPGVKHQGSGVGKEKKK